MKRVITITMDIDKSTHTMWLSHEIKEDGKKKKVWTEAEAISTARAMIASANDLLGELATKLIELGDAAAKTQDDRVDDLVNMM